MNKTKKILASVVLGLMAFATPMGAVSPADYGLHEGDVIRASGDLDVYIVNDYGFKRLFVNPQIFNLYGHLGFDKVKEVMPATRDAFVTSGLFRNCESGDLKVYGLEVVSEDVANLHWVNVSGAQAAAEDAAFFKKVFCINSAEQALYGIGSVYTSLSQIPAYSRGGAVGGSGELQGGVGELTDASFVSSLSNEEVGEGDSNVKVAGLDLDVDEGSDLKFLSTKLSLESVDSNDLDDFADVVSVWLGSKKVAEVDVNSMNEDGGVWSKTVSLDNAIVRADGSETLFVAVSALDNIDSADLGAVWTVTIESLRYVDADGAITSDTSTGNIGDARAFSFESFAEVADLELKVTEGSDNPVASVVEIDENSGKDGVFLLSAKVKAIGGEISLNDVEFVASASAGVVDGYTLDVDGEEFSEETPVFDLGGLTISEDDYVMLRLYVDVNEDADGKVISAKLQDADIEAEDKNGDAVSASGDVDGEDQLLAIEGVNVALVSVDADVSGEGNEVGTFKINFNVTAFGGDATITGVNYDFTNSATESEAFDLDIEGDDNVVEEGQTKLVKLTVVISDVVDEDFYKVWLTGVLGDFGVYDFNLDDFEAGPVYLN